ncbi:Protein detoxification 42 [Vitis vinifera]|uniref:Protein detoxification 42 n=1 Tax=Vitis vinifera TaxID=29760 RepID=A0A438JLD1_VITVI|nr:Protein detoxification 42 [Vitis vinifera]
MLPLNICKGKSSRWLRESPEQVACRLKKYSRQAGKLDLYALTYKCSDKWTAHSAYAHALTGKYLHRGMHLFTLSNAVLGDVANIILDPILMFVFRLGVSGAAIAHVISQYLISVILLWRLMRKVDLLPPSIKDLQLGRFLRNGSLLLVRVIAVTFCVTLAASLAARLGSTSMAAFQVCLQIWLATSLLADGLAVAGQAILASAFAKKDYDKATATASRVLQLGLVLGLVLSVFLLVVLQYASRVFTKDVNVLQLMNLGIPFVAVTQPINALAFVFDGVNFGASDFAYSACSMASL